MKLWFISQNNVLENEHNSLSLNQTSLELSTHSNSSPTATGVMQQRPVCRRLHIFNSAVLLRHDLHQLSIHAGAVSWTVVRKPGAMGDLFFLHTCLKHQSAISGAHLASAVSSSLKMTNSYLNSSWTTRQLRICARHWQNMDSPPHCCLISALGSCRKMDC